MNKNKMHDVKNMVIALILAALNITVFVLCVDRGFTPVAILGATYIAFRLFAADALVLMRETKTVADIAAEAAAETIERNRQLKLEQKTAETEVTIK